MQANPCASQLLPCAVPAGSTARPKAETRETGQGSPERGPCTGQQSKALVQVITDAMRLSSPGNFAVIRCCL